MSMTDMNRKKDQRGRNGALRERIRKAAEGLRDKSERAKNMSEETKMEQETAQEAQTPEVDAAALAAELEKVKAQCDEYLDLAQQAGRVRQLPPPHRGHPAGGL